MFPLLGSFNYILMNLKFNQNYKETFNIVSHDSIFCDKLIRITIQTLCTVYGTAFSFYAIEYSNFSKTIYLFQNYHNSFNPTTLIIFRTSDFGLVNLKIIDILGSEVATLVNEEKPEGSYEVEFSAGSGGNGSNLPSGVYFYKLEQENLLGQRN